MRFWRARVRIRFSALPPASVARWGSASFGAGLGQSQTQQLLPLQIQVHQPAYRKHLVGILLQSSVTQLHESKLQLHHPKHVLYLRPHPRLRPVLRPLHFVNTILVAITPMGTVQTSKPSRSLALPFRWPSSARIIPNGNGRPPKRHFEGKRPVETVWTGQR